MTRKAKAKENRPIPPHAPRRRRCVYCALRDWVRGRLPTPALHASIHIRSYRVWHGGWALVWYAWLFAIGLMAALCVAAYIYFKRRTFTREKFAFAAFSGVLALIGLYLPMLFGGAYPWDLLLKIDGVGTFAFAKGDSSPSLSAQILGAAVIFWLGNFANKIYANWNGARSVLQVEAQEISSKSSLYVDVITLLASAERRKKSRIIYKRKQVGEDVIFSEPIDSRRPWPERIGSLINLTNFKFSVDPLKGWHESASAFLATPKLPGHGSAIFACFQSSVDVPALQYAELLAKHHNVQQEKYLVVGGAIEAAPAVDGWITIPVPELIDALRSQFNSYYQSLEAQFREERYGFDHNISLGEMYVDCDARLSDGSQVSLSQYLAEWSIENSTRQLAILGEYGQGKSVCCLKFAIDLMKQNGRIPLLIELRGKSPRNLDSDELIAAWCISKGINQEAVKAVIEFGEAVILFDGFDEMDLIVDREMRLQNFRSLWQFAAFPDAKVLITGRPNLFLDEADLKLSLGVEKKSATLPYCVAVSLKKFDASKIGSALRPFPENIRAEILAAAQSESASGGFSDLISRPSTLALVATIWDDIKRNATTGRINSAAVIREFILHAYARQKEKVSRNLEARPILTLNERHFFMQCIANEAWNIGGRSNQISSSQLRQVISRVSEVMPDFISEEGSVFDPSAKPLRERIATMPFGREAVLNDVCAAGILVNDASAVNKFKFAHKSFHEYLVGCAISVAYWPERCSEAKLIVASNGFFPILRSWRVSYEAAQFGSEILVEKLGGERPGMADILYNHLFGKGWAALISRQWKIFPLQAFGPYALPLIQVLRLRWAFFLAYCMKHPNGGYTFRKYVGYYVARIIFSTRKDIADCKTFREKILCSIDRTTNRWMDIELPRLDETPNLPPADGYTVSASEGSCVP